MKNTSSYKYLDYAPQKIIFEVVCNSPRTETGDVLGAVMASSSAHSACSIATLLSKKVLGRIKVQVLSCQAQIKKFTVQIPIKLEPALLALFSANIEQLSTVGSAKASFIFKTVVHESSERESRVVQRAEQILENLKTACESKDAINPILSYFSKHGIDPVVEKEVKVMALDKEAGLFSSPSFNEREGPIILVEGVSDIRTLYRAGHYRILSISGNGIEQNVDTLNKILKDSEVFLFMDGDRGGMALKEKLKSLINCRVLKVVQEKNYGEVQLLTKLQIDSILSRAVITATK